MKLIVKNAKPVDDTAVFELVSSADDYGVKLLVDGREFLSFVASDTEPGKIHVMTMDTQNHPRAKRKRHLEYVDV